MEQAKGLQGHSVNVKKLSIRQFFNSSAVDSLLSILGWFENIHFSILINSYFDEPLPILKYQESRLFSVDVWTNLNISMPPIQ